MEAVNICLSGAIYTYKISGYGILFDSRFHSEFFLAALTCIPFPEYTPILDGSNAF